MYQEISNVINMLEYTFVSSFQVVSKGVCRGEETNRWTLTQKLKYQENISNRNIDSVNDSESEAN